MAQPKIRKSKSLLLATIGASILAGVGATPALAADESSPAGAAAQASPAAAAQDRQGADQYEGGPLGDIVVTARRRDERLQDVPQAVTAMTTEQLQREQVSDQSDLQQKVPSLSIASRFGQTGGTYGMRGLSGQSTSTPTVGTYFAEIPTPTNNLGIDTSAGTPMYDLESVQVLKGPQGTLFGRSSTAGAVLITPAAPDLNDFKATGGLALGNLGYFQGTLAVSVPIIDGVLAIRAAAQYNHRNGYTTVIGTDRKLDETNNEAQRLTVLFQPASWFKNTTIYNRFHASQASGAYLAVGYNPNFPLFNLPANTTAFDAACGAAVASGWASTVSACVAQRLAIMASTKANLAAESARTARGGDELRRTLSGNATYFNERITHESVINRTELTLPELGPLQLQLKNIFGYQRTRGYAGLNVSGVPDELLTLYVGVGAGLSGNQAGNTAQIAVGPGEKFYSNETQLSGTLFGDRLAFVGGYYYQHAPSTVDLVNVGGVQKSLGGVTTVNLGYGANRPFTVGGRANQSAWYGQATLGLDGLLDGVHLTAGVRHTKDDFLLLTRAAVTNPVTGVYTPSPTLTTQALKTSGTNYNFSIDYKPTPKLMIYASTRKGYVPGGLNNSSAIGAPNFQLQYGSENIEDVEVGFKWDFNLGDMRGRLNVAGYKATYSDIQRSFTSVLNNAVASYVANVAKGELEGVEVELTVAPTRELTFGLNYSFNGTRYTSWIGADPYGAAPAGTNIDLKDNPFQNAPRHKLNANATYDIPLAGDKGTVSITGQFTYQSEAYYLTAANRYIQIYGESARQAVREDGFGIVNVRLDWRDIMGLDGVTASIFARNLFEEIYATSATPLNNSLGFSSKQFSEPRIVGASISFNY
ncbi:TonB-dependent receptor [Sphingomonas sp. MG17]|uniref:TonB-dependent receptor n=1 Tax=Sphingomonas tagetis TaxID=2949092 RepID=A0A9X2HSK1_9SPHN|nr:TonB-dependent receptor [Sphingomonas tagetis]MCP3732799.1 TonB-dependent receptor [Sphingomonas tagetis]